MEYNGLSLEWPGYSTIRVETDAGLVVYLDPGRSDYGVLDDETPHDADHILVSHTHHYDPWAIRNVATAETQLHVLDDVVDLVYPTPEQAEMDLEPPSELEFDLHVFEYEEAFEIDGIEVKTVPAYNLPSPEGLNIRPDGNGLQPPGTCVGFHLTVDDTRLFWTSDSDVLDEQKALDVDVLFPPISQVVTMDRRQALDLVQALEPDLVIPVHYCWKGKTPDGPVFLSADPTAFQDDVADLGIRCEVI